MSAVLTYDSINKLFNTFNTPPGWTDSPSYGAYHSSVSENAILVEVPLVGMSRENVTVEVVDNVLTVNAKTDNNTRYARNFSQSWTLTKDADSDNINAKLENGLLIVNIPRIKPTKKIVNVQVV